VPEGRLLLSPDGRATVRVGKPAAIGRANSGRPDQPDGPLAKPDAIVLLEMHDRPEIVAERIDAEAAAARMAATVDAELRAGLAQRDLRDAQLAGRGWISARRAPGVAMRLLREATLWKPCYAVRHPETATAEELREAIAPVLPEKIAAERTTAPAPVGKKQRDRRSSTPGSPPSEQAQRRAQG